MLESNKEEKKYRGAEVVLDAEPEQLREGHHNLPDLVRWDPHLKSRYSLSVLVTSKRSSDFLLYKRSEQDLVRWDPHL